jgi:hypothetical protein
VVPASLPASLMARRHEFAMAIGLPLICLMIERRAPGAIIAAQSIFDGRYSGGGLDEIRFAS